MSPYVVVNIAGTKPDSEPVLKTQAVQNNGFHPIWNESIEFSLREPEMALLQLIVYNAGTNEHLGLPIRFQFDLSIFRTCNFSGRLYSRRFPSSTLK